ncbi:hypothetical protein GGTG_06822 [Gaeumannomyces tritici R3-111a-1]|uniref:Uncharacterized protein n=1 Tax=Gaeumannomyces tritici (strain R3-111a-1) TaxID=644352 RepID=J3NZX5_GAET3|nr:hypothetical protein GGTG_06822 [Gaeumannomyces tritici R3-111a-1]EJT76908.1 hypothetical protein GGTG_06822 [Gaeumannomyces tritici R3-111a-1]
MAGFKAELLPLGAGFASAAVPLVAGAVTCIPVAAPCGNGARATKPAAPRHTIRLVVMSDKRVSTNSKRVDIKNSWLSEAYYDGKIEFAYITTAEMPADGLTKNLKVRRAEGPLPLAALIAGVAANEPSGTRAILPETRTSWAVNGDGGGPYTCSINLDATAQQWTPIQVATTPPGQNSRNRQGAATDFPMVAAIPASQQCTGTAAGQKNVCLVRCQNAARTGPFGGVVPIQMAGAGAGAAAGSSIAASAKAARSNLAREILRREALFRKVMKRQQAEEDDEEDEE